VFQHTAALIYRSNNDIVVRSLRKFTPRTSLRCCVTILVVAAVLVGCGNKETGKPQSTASPSLILLPSVQPTLTPTVQLTPTPFIPGPLFDPNLDLKAGPVEVPLYLRIPLLKVNAPVLGVGLTPNNVMDAPKGPMDDPIWHAAFWFRGSGIPGAPGTAAIAGHVNDVAGRPEIFYHLKDLKPGSLIIIHVSDANVDMSFFVDQVEVYSVQQSNDPAVLEKIFGAGPVAGTGPQPSLDGLSHLTLITCDGYIVNGQFDHHVVVYATRSH
jgi:sortase (surface protein transpeptidase)